MVDYSSEQLEMLRSFGLRVYFGDATRPDLLHAAGIDEAKVIVIAIDDKEAITELTRYICKTYPHVHVVARAVDRMHVYELWAVGCRDIVRETYDSSIRATRSVLEALGNPRDAAERMLVAFEQMDRQVMVELADLYDIDIPIAENQAYLERARAMRDDWEKQLQGQMRDASRASSSR